MKRRLLIIFFVISFLSLGFAWELVSNAPMLLRFEDENWNASQDNLNEILQTSPFSSLIDYAVSLNREEANSLLGGSELYRLHILNYGNDYYPLVVDSGGNIIKNHEILSIIYAALTNTAFSEEEVIDYYKNVNATADLLTRKLQSFTLKDRERLASEALDFLNRQKEQELGFDRFLEKALEENTPYYELALYDTANVLKNELSRIKALSIEHYNRYSKYPSDSILSFNSAEWLYSANNEVNNIYNYFHSLSYKDLERSLIRLYMNFVVEKKIQAIDKLIEEPAEIPDKFKTSREEAKATLVRLNQLLEKTLPAGIPDKLPSFITVPSDGSVITLPLSSKVTIKWYYTLPYRIQPLFYISYGKAGEKAQLISTKSNALTLQTAPFSEYEIIFNTPEGGSPYKMSFSTLLGELPAPEVPSEIKVTKELEKDVLINWAPPIDGHNFKYRVYVHETELSVFTSSNSVLLNLTEFKKYTLDITPVEIDGFKIPQELRKTAFTVVEVLPEYPLSSTTPEKALKGSFKLTWKAKSSQNIDKYIVLVYRDPKGKEKLIEAETTDNEFPVMLQPHQSYYWTVEILYSNGRKISNRDSMGNRILWPLEVANAKPSIKISPMKGTIHATRTVFPIKLLVKDEDDDMLIVGYEKSPDPSFVNPVTMATKKLKGQGEVTFDVFVAEAESFFVRGFVSDGFEKVYSSPVSLSMQYHWEAEPDGITTDSTHVKLSWELKEPKMPIGRYKILLSWEIHKEIVSEGRVEVKTETKTFETNENFCMVELSPHTLYTWQVTSILKDGSEGPHSSPLAFRTPNKKPFAQLFLNENFFKDNDSVDINNDTISWEADDPDGDKVNISLEVLDENGVLFEATPVTNKIKVSEIPGLSGNKTYTLNLILNDGVDSKFGAGKTVIKKIFKTKNRAPEIQLSKPDDIQNPDHVFFTIFAADPDDDRLTISIRLDGIPIGDIYIDQKASETINLSSLLQENISKIKPHLWKTEKLLMKNGSLILKGHTEYNLEVTVSDTYGANTSAVTVLPVNNRNPEKPVIIAPRNNSIHELSEEMQWHSEDNDGDDIIFKIFVKDEESGESIVSTATALYSWAMDRVLTGNRRYLVKVTALDSYGGKSESDWVSFYAPNRAPKITSLHVTPIGYETLDASISWSAIDPDNEKVSMALTIKNDLGKAIHFDKTLPPTGSQTIALPRYGNYSVILKATDENKGETEISTALTIPDRSPKPTNPSTPVEIWFTKMERKYTLYASTTFIDPDGDYLTLRATLYELTPDGSKTKINHREFESRSPLSKLIDFWGLKGHTDYRLLLEIQDQPDGVANKSSEFTIDFETPNAAPLVTLLEPNAFAKEVAYSPTSFKWNAEDFEEDSIHFDLEIVEKETGESTILSTDEFLAKINLKPHTTYLWNLRANDDFGGTFQSDVREFTTLNNSPSITANTPNFKEEMIYPIFTAQATDIDGDSLTLLITIRDAKTAETVLATRTITTRTFKAVSEKFTGNHEYIAQFTAIEKELPVNIRRTSSKTISFTTPNRSPKINKLLINGEKAVDSPTVNKKGIMLSWEAVDPDEEQLSYNITLILIDGKNEIKSVEINNLKDNYYHFDKALKGHAEYKLVLEALDEHGGIATQTALFKTENTAPEILSMVAPKETREPTQTEFSWSAYDDDEDLLNYELSIWSEDGSYNLTIPVKKGITSYIATNGLPGHKKYRWSVTAFDGYGGKSTSVSVPFETENNPPTIKPVFPKDNSKDLPDTIEFYWTAFDEDHDKLSYTFHLFEAGKAVYTLNTGESTSIEIPQLKGNTKYSWYVEVNDGYVDRPVNSQYYHFEVKNHVPLVHLIIPKFALNPDLAAISWSAFDLDKDALMGKLRILNSNGKDAVEPIVLDTKASSTVYIEGLIGNREYTALISIEDGQGGVATDTCSFHTSNRPPHIPEPALPCDFAVVDTDFRDFSWNSSDPDGDALTHDILLECLTGDDALEIFDTTATRFKTSFLRPYSIYRWKITVRDNHGGVTESPYWYFITNPSADKGFEPYFSSMTAQQAFEETLVFAGTLNGELIIFNKGKQIDREKLSTSAIVELYAPKYSDLLKPEEINYIRNAIGRFFSADTWPLIIAKDSDGNSYKIVVTDCKELTRGKNIFIFPMQ